MLLSILFVPETVVVASSCASALLGSVSVLGFQSLRKKRDKQKQSDIDTRHLPKNIKAGTVSAIEAKNGASRPKTREEEAKEFNQEGEKSAAEAYSNTKNWLISTLNGDSEESRASILRKFYRFGYHTYVRQVPVVMGFGGYGMDQRYWQLESRNLHFVSALEWEPEEGQWVTAYYSGSLWKSVADEEVGRALPHTEADWEAFARLVETAETDGVAMEKVDRFIQLSVANLLLNLNTPAGAMLLSLAPEDLAEAGRRQEEIGQICFELLTRDLREWEVRARAPKQDTVEVAKNRAAEMIAEEAEAAKRKEEEAAEEEAAEEEAEQARIVIDEKTGEVKTLPDEPLVVRFREAYASMTEAEQRAGDKYVERLVEAAEAEQEAADFSESAKNRVISLATENRRIALEQLEGLLAASGTSREAVLVHSLRVSNKYLVERQAEGV